MKKTSRREKNRALELIKKISVEIENARPSKEQMIEDIKMMGFKIRSLAGNIFELAKREREFLEPLWKIGKIEKIVFGRINQLNDEEKQALFRYLNNFQRQTEERISAQELTGTGLLELEVLKERIIRKRRLN
jgi:hypothetical protein